MENNTTKVRPVFFEDQRQNIVTSGVTRGYRWEVYFVEYSTKTQELFHCVSYAKLDKSSSTKSDFYGETFREGDVIGFDTAHAWSHGWWSKNQPVHKQAAAHIASAMSQVQHAIKQHADIFGDGNEVDE